MNAYALYKSFWGLVGLAIISVSGLWLCIYNIYHQLALESFFSKKFGDGWRDAYEANIGSLASARTKMAISAGGIVAISLVIVWFYKVLRNARHPSFAPVKNVPRRRRFHSSSERNAYCRRNALVGIYFGVAGIFAGIALVLFRFGIFADHVNEAWLGLVFFLGGYISVITGCSWWLKAKHWNPSVVLIGVMPLGILFIPFVRLILFSSPEILPIGMFFAALILIVVVFVLPDHSGQTRPKHRWNRKPMPAGRIGDETLVGKRTDR